MFYEKSRQFFRWGGGFNSHVLFDEISSHLNIFRAWNEFKRGKIQKQDVGEFSANVEDRIFALADDLRSGKYRHSKYIEFYIYDPKRRHIHKAEVIDRLLHHAIFRVLEPIYDKKFIFDSYSSRPEKGTHKACQRFHDFAWKLSQNNTKCVWALKCDIKKYFDSIDHEILIKMLRGTIHDEKTNGLLKEIIYSFKTEPRKGIPLGNLTSQLFSNVYLDRFDQYVKRNLRIKHYVRYADDFAVLDTDRDNLLKLIPKFTEFLDRELLLSMHPDKVYIRKFSQGIDFLGYVIFPHHFVLRTRTKKRMLRKVTLLKKYLDDNVITQEYFDQALASYFDILKHCYGHRIKKTIKGIIPKITKTS